MTDSSPRYKVARVAAAYDIDDVRADLADYWTRTDDRYSLRELADHFNQQVLRAAMENAGIRSLDGEVENTYRLLTAGDVSSGVRTQTRRRLERDGVKVATIENDFVTYQAIRTYLREAENVERDRSDDDRSETVTESIKRLQNRTTAVTREKLDRLRNGGEIDLGEFQILLDLRAFCETCGNQYDAVELIERGGCECHASGEATG